MYPNQSYKIYNWIWGIILENPGIKSVNLRLQVNMVPYGRHLTPVEKIMIFQFSEQGYHGQNLPKLLGRVGNQYIKSSEKRPLGLCRYHALN